MSDPSLVEVVIIFASVGALLLGVASWLLKGRPRVEAIGPNAGGPTIWTPKVIALTTMGAGITLLFVGGVNEIIRHQFRMAAWLLFVGVGLVAVFFRHRKIALAITVPSVLLAMAGPIVLVRPTRSGIVITLVSAVLLLVLSMWLAKRYPHMRRGDFKQFFDRDPA